MTPARQARLDRYLTEYLVQSVETANRLRALVRPTTLVQSDLLDEHVGEKVILASETFQRTGSFKFRAAFNIAQNTPSNELIAASSGNFGQALAYACRLLGKTCYIVMPDNSAGVKIEAVRRFGGNVVLVEVARKTRVEAVRELAQQHPDATVVSAFDDPHVIAGNATLGEELAAKSDLFDAVIVPVGGGGLISGVITGMAAKGCNKPIFGAEPSIANDAARSLKQGQLVRNESEPQTIADGVRTLSLGEHNWRIIKDGVSGIIEVPEDKIKEAARMLFNFANLKAEPTGALALAAVLTDPTRFASQTVCCIVSGGNVDPSVLFDLLSEY
jgi:threonine dehydratase